MPDHFVDHDLAPTVALAHVAAVTDTLRVGPLVLGNDYKHPVVLARETATLDLLSDGRLELGIGAGWMTADYEKAGMPLDRAGRAHRAARRVDHGPQGPVRARAVHVPRRALPSDRARRDAEAAAAPHLPFLIGGGAPKILALAAKRSEDRRDQREPPAPAKASRRRPRSRSCPKPPTRSSRGCATPPATAFDDLEIQTLLGFVHVTDDAGRHREGDGRLVRCLGGRRAARAGDARRFLDGIVDILEQRRERWQMWYIVVPDESAETLAPVVARLAGN